MGSGRPWRWCEFELPLGISAEAFQLEKAVCSHGLFMMAPNYWDPLSHTLTRPLRLPLSDDCSSSSSPLSGSVIVTISQPSHRPSSLTLRVHGTGTGTGTGSISAQQQHSLLAQVSRMLRLSETEEKAVREFTNMSIYGEDDQNKGFNGRVFRSPTLFEDMVKCILLCNCQWPRTLSMAQALCELQLELQNVSSIPSVVEVGARASTSQKEKVEKEDYIPKTPATNETKKKHKTSGFSSKGKFLKNKLEFEGDGNSQEDRVFAKSLNSSLPPTDTDANLCQHSESCDNSKELSVDDESFLGFSNGRDYFANGGIGNFPSPEELANLDKSFLAKRCKLGYRAGRIVKLARAIVEGRVQIGLLEELSKDASLLSYNQLTDRLKEIEGFGPFTRANVLMCMGYYHVIPTDSETIRHLKQAHSRQSTTQTVQRDVEEIYGKYEPYQFLAYWSEVWDFYERRFGKMNEMSCSDYKLITASNMRSEGRGSRKKRKGVP
ncbi:hypothetical protein QN277_009891 [Acacia crassicarpa]|uniref:HhH-GPD domain-containing protein n=1 Tax=Acacia crassicarpa TaxID=499986 RepID=A0AAE1IP35_9FABA|nr:hypothetical protein QN277_009891 [Acacia crassicarpa]